MNLVQNVVVDVSVQQVVGGTTNTEKLRAQETQTDVQGTTKTFVSWKEPIKGTRLGEEKLEHESGVTLTVVQLHKAAAQLEASCKGRLPRHRKLPFVSGSPVFECQTLSVDINFRGQDLTSLCSVKWKLEADNLVIIPWSTYRTSSLIWSLKQMTLIPARQQVVNKERFLN